MYKTDGVYNIPAEPIPNLLTIWSVRSVRYKRRRKKKKTHCATAHLFVLLVVLTSFFLSFSFCFYVFWVLGGVKGRRKNQKEFDIMTTAAGELNLARARTNARDNVGNYDTNLSTTRTTQQTLTMFFVLFFFSFMKLKIRNNGGKRQLGGHKEKLINKTRKRKEKVRILGLWWHFLRGTVSWTQSQVFIQHNTYITRWDLFSTHSVLILDDRIRNKCWDL